MKYEWPIKYAWFPVMSHRVEPNEKSITGGWWVNDGLIWLRHYKEITNIVNGKKYRVVV